MATATGIGLAAGVGKYLILKKNTPKRASKSLEFGSMVSIVSMLCLLAASTIGIASDTWTGKINPYAGDLPPNE